jgi:hypothetical protein
MVDSFIDHCVNLDIGDISDLLGSAVKEDFEFLRKRPTTPRWRNLLWRNGGDADFLIGTHRSTKELFNGGLHLLRQITCLMY